MIKISVICEISKNRQNFKIDMHKEDEWQIYSEKIQS